MKSRIADPQLEWDESGTPLSKLHQDPYFSREDGLAESRHVFLEGNDLPRRFAAMTANQQFVVAETGFGTGLNFLLSWQLFNQLAPSDAQLFFVSVEGFPMQTEQLAKSHAAWPELSVLSERLRDQWPARVPGFHWLELDCRVQLLLIFDQADAGLSELTPRPDRRSLDALPRPVDAWFLDGFAPSRNQDMWNDNLFGLIGQLSHEHTSLATFSVAGDVRRGLAAVGFDCQKTPGFGRKREMLQARMRQPDKPIPANPHSKTGKYHQVWHQHPALPANLQERVAIVGGGIAGISLALQLNRAGRRVDLFDAQDHLAAVTSGNPQAAIFARVSPGRGELEDFALASLAYACRYYRHWWNQGEGQQCGILQLPRSLDEANRIRELALCLPGDNGLLQWVERQQASEIAGLDLDQDALFMPTAGWINARPLVETLQSAPGNRFFCGERPQIRQLNGRWQLETAQINEEYQQLVLCSGYESIEAKLPFIAPLEKQIKPVGGQISLIRTNERASRLKTILCQRHYLTPALNGLHSLGATYRLRDASLQQRHEDDESNQQFLNVFAEFTEVSLAGSRVGVRATTPDYLPLCGPVPRFDVLADLFDDLSRDARNLSNKTVPSHPGLFCLRGLGSRGFTYAPLLAAHLCSQILGRQSPLPDHLKRAIHPARFAIRDIIRSTA